MYSSLIVRSIITSLVVFIAAGAAVGQCPTITVIGPPGLTNSGDKMRFRVEVGPPEGRLEYVWSIDKGTIIEGQGKKEIYVATDALWIDAVKAMVTVTGLASGCKNSASETAPVAPAGVDPPLIDEYARLSKNDERGRLDAFLSELVINPDNIGLVVLMVRHGERYDSKNRRVQFILSHLNYRKFDKRRIWFSLEKSPEARTRFYRYPQDVIDIFTGDNPPCKPCLIIKGGDIK